MTGESQVIGVPGVNRQIIPAPALDPARLTLDDRLSLVIARLDVEFEALEGSAHLAAEIERLQAACGQRRGEAQMMKCSHRMLAHQPGAELGRTVVEVDLTA